MFVFCKSHPLLHRISSFSFMGCGMSRPSAAVGRGGSGGGSFSGSEYEGGGGGTGRFGTGDDLENHEKVLLRKMSGSSVDENDDDDWKREDCKSRKKKEEEEEEEKNWGSGDRNIGGDVREDSIMACPGSPSFRVYCDPPVLEGDDEEKENQQENSNKDYSEGRSNKRRRKAGRRIRNALQRSGGSGGFAHLLHCRNPSSTSPM